MKPTNPTHSMKQRTMLLLAAGITAFVLVLVGGFAAYVTAPAASTAPPVSQTGVVGVTQSSAEQGSTPGSEALYRQQLQEARALIEEANSRLSAAYGELAVQDPTRQDAANTSSASTSSTSSSFGAQSGAVTITPDQATLIGAAAAPGAVLLGGPELVSFQGTLAYELQFDKGALYVDATTGSVLDNTAVKPPFTSSLSQVGGDDYDDGDEGHEDGEDDD
jgi:hypothetical protein